MAKHSYRLLEEAVNRQAEFVGDMAAGDEFEHDFGEGELAVLAAGWVERIDEPTKGGKK